MAISLASDLLRPKAAQTIAVPVSVTVTNPTESDGDDSFTQYITTVIEPDTITVSCTADNSDVTLTAATGHDIRIGDVVSGTGIQAGTAVSGISGNTITIDNATTQAITDQSLTFNAPTTTARVMALFGTFTVSGTNVSLRVRGYKADGTKTGGAGGADGAAYTDMGAALFDQTIRLDLDKFLSDARVARTNS